MESEVSWEFFAEPISASLSEEKRRADKPVAVCLLLSRLGSRLCSCAILLEAGWWRWDVLFLCVVSVVAACVELPSYLEKPIAEMSTAEYVNSVRS